MNRRGFILGLIASPAIVKYEWLMPVKKVFVPDMSMLMQSTGTWTPGPRRFFYRVIVTREIDRLRIRELA